jgi:hypothetical protein
MGEDELTPTGHLIVMTGEPPARANWKPLQ